MALEKTRVEDTRSAEERASYYRKNLRNDYQDPLYIDPNIIPPDVKYRWVRDSVYGQPDPGRMAVMERKGWTPVPSSRHPEYGSNITSVHKPSHYRGYIYFKGLVLCERALIYCEEEERMAAEENYKVQNAMPGLDHMMSDPRMPQRVFINEKGYGPLT